MLPSSSRVKLNRVPLKDVVGLELALQRRRPPKPKVKAFAKSPKQEKMSVSDFVSEEDAASGAGSNEPLQSGFVEPENGAETPCSHVPVGGKLEQNTNSTDLQLCPGHDMERKQHGPNTRGKYEGNKPTLEAEMDQLRETRGGEAPPCRYSIGSKLNVELGAL